MIENNYSEEVYIVVMNGGFAGAVTICDPAIADNCIRQLRSGGRRVRVFRDREKYLNFLEKDLQSRRENIRLQRFAEMGSMSMKDFTLRSQLEENKSWYLKHFGCLNWQWTDEGIPNTILDYHSSIGSVQDFTEDDWAVAAEYGWTREEVEALCCHDEVDVEVQESE